MKLSLKFAQQLNNLMQGDSLPFSLFNRKEMDLFLSEQLLHLELIGRSKKLVLIIDKPPVNNYLKHKFGISNLTEYISLLQNENASVIEASIHASDSKIKSVRNITGFLANSITPINATINSQTILFPTPCGTQCFISDYANFFIPENVIIVGVENAASYLFTKPSIFV